MIDSIVDFLSNKFSYGVFGGLFLIWLYMCFALIPEDQIKIVESFSGQWVRGLSGIEDKKVAKSGEIVDGKQPRCLLFGIIPLFTRNMSFIWYGFQYISTYEMRKIVRIEGTELTAEELKTVAWGNPGDTKVSVTRRSISNHYRKQFTYEMHFDGLESGHEAVPIKDTVPEAAAASSDGSTPPPEKPKVIVEAMPQNVKFRVRLQVTTYAVNVRHTRYQEGDGGKWLTTLNDTILSGLNILFCDKGFSSISKMKGKKISDQMLTFGDGDQRNDQKFVDYVNDEMLNIKKLGQGVRDFNFLDLDISPESKRYTDALDNLTVSEVEKQTAGNKADAESLRLAPKVNATIQINTAIKNAKLELLKQPNLTIVSAMEKIPSGVKFLNVNFGDVMKTSDTKDVSNDMMNFVMSHEIAEDLNEPDVPKKHTTKEKGGKK